MKNPLLCRASFYLVLSAYSLVLAPVPPAAAEVPHLIRYQGQAVDSNDVPLEGPYTLTFRLYDAETLGTEIWQEAHPNVPLTNGQFSVLLGQERPLKDVVDWSEPCWLSIQVNTDPELTPRQRITSVPLAIRAEVAEVLATPTTTSTITDDANRLVPPGAIILWAGASCPPGYTRDTTYDDRFLVGSSTAGSAGGSDAHDHGSTTGSHALTAAEMPGHAHSTPPHTHTVRARGGRTPYSPGSIDALVSPIPWGSLETGDVFGTSEGGGTSGAEGGDVGHTHPLSSADNRPAFKTILLCQKD